jgi:hypothetical protein
MSIAGTLPGDTPVSTAGDQSAHRARLTTAAVGGALTALLALWLLLFTTSAAAGADPLCTHLGYQGVVCASTFADMAGAGEEEDEGTAEEAQEEGGEAARGEGAGNSASDEEAASAEAEAEEAAADTSSSQSAGSRGESSAVLSHLELTANTIAALEHRPLSASAIGFSFYLSAPTKVQVTFVKQSTLHGRKHWTTLPDSFALSLAQGHVARSLTGRNRLSPGRYRLTVKPLGGHSRAIYLSAHR